MLSSSTVISNAWRGSCRQPYTVNPVPYHDAICDSAIHQTTCRGHKSSVICYENHIEIMLYVTRTLNNFLANNFNSTLETPRHETLKHTYSNSYISYRLPRVQRNHDTTKTAVYTNCCLLDCTQSVYIWFRHYFFWGPGDYHSQLCCSLCHCSM